MKYDIILADPPWNFRTWSDKGRDRSPDYPVMSLKDIKALPVGDIASDNCALFIWGTNPMLPDVLDVIKAWGFTYKTKAFCWVKTTGNARYHMGLGYWTRANPEDCWLATRGKPIRLSKAVRQLVVYRVGEHSRKPLIINDRIEDLLGKLPRVELFARRRRTGWLSLGYDIDGKDIRLSLQELIDGTAIR
jgi:N6-adenosine-specific RNA methylase IME4